MMVRNSSKRGPRRVKQCSASSRSDSRSSFGRFEDPCLALGRPSSEGTDAPGPSYERFLGPWKFGHSTASRVSTVIGHAPWVQYLTVRGIAIGSVGGCSRKAEPPKGCRVCDVYIEGLCQLVPPSGCGDVTPMVSASAGVGMSERHVVCALSGCICDRGADPFPCLPLRSEESDAPRCGTSTMTRERSEWLSAAGATSWNGGVAESQLVRRSEAFDHHHYHHRHRPPQHRLPPARLSPWPILANIAYNPQLPPPIGPFAVHRGPCEAHRRPMNSSAMRGSDKVSRRLGPHETHRGHW